MSHERNQQMRCFPPNEPPPGCDWRQEQYYVNNNNNYRPQMHHEERVFRQQQQQYVYTQHQQQQQHHPQNPVQYHHHPQMEHHAGHHPNYHLPAHRHHRQYEPSLVSMDGIQSGVPTLTTSTLTPTTLRNIEQTFIELTSDPPTALPYLAGFVPPKVPSNFQDNSHDNNSMGSSDSGSQSSWHSPLSHEENSTTATDNSNTATGLSTSLVSGLPTTTKALGILSSAASTSSTTTTRKNQGGRRPAKTSNLSPEEEEKRKIRRERNKLAAARCRKRRVDLTNELQGKVAELEQEKQALQKTIEELRFVKDEIQMCLEAHRAECRRNKDLLARASPIDVKPNLLTSGFVIKDEPLDPIDSLDGPPSPKKIMLSSNSSNVMIPLPNLSSIAATIASNTSILNTPTTTVMPLTSLPNKPNRPSSLNVPITLTPAQIFGINRNITDIAGVPITTPSNGTFNFDSLMDGGTGLTPVSNLPLMPTCSSQNSHPLELKTPTSEPSKLVSL